MKSKKLLLTTIIIGFLGLACEDYLDFPPEASISEENIFSSYYSFQGFIDQCYSRIVDYNSHAICVSQNLGGEAIAVQSWTCSYMASRGDYWSLVQYGRSNYIGYQAKGIWLYSWEGIRIANIALEKLKTFKGSEKEAYLLKGQALFFRAFFHWEIARSYGTIPYITEPLTDDFKLPRHWEYNGKKDYQAVTEKIVEDLDRAAELLPEIWDNWDANKGRVTKGAALALKAKALLYAGSPLMNEFSGKTASFDTEYMMRAAEAAMEVIKLADKGIYSLTDFEKYKDNFAKMDGSMPFTSETIFQKHKSDVGSGQVENMQGRLYFPNSSVFGGNAITETPTQQYVDKFEMADGTRYKPGGPEQGGYDYDNDKRWNFRDPRFRKAIYVDGDMAGYDPSTLLTLYDDGPTRKASYMLCPYVVHKFWPKGVNKTDKMWNNFRYVTPHLRLAEIYLIYAEGIYEATNNANSSVNGSTLTALEAVNIVRRRAGMPDVDANPAEYESFRELLRNERAVELCFEGHYWFDIRLWKIAKSENPD